MYTGEEIFSSNVFAANITFVLTVMMYGTGLPVLYAFAAVFLFVNYWIYKWLLIKFYKKTTVFNEEMAFNSV